MDRIRTCILAFVSVFLFFIAAAAAAAPTTVAIQDGKWRIHGAVTYPGTRAEGLLLNVRMVNAVFEDAKRPDFDPDVNTDAFIAKIPDYMAHGVRAFTFCLQGGTPGYEGAVNSAFAADGSLRPGYLARVGRVIEACDREGLVVILGCYYQRQVRILKDDDAIRAGVEATAKWIQRQGWRHVMLEIANEYPHTGFKVRPLLKSPEGEAELIRLAKKTAPGLLVAASGYGDGKLDDAVAKASDFLLIHFNSIKPEGIPACVEKLRKYGKPIVCNEDADVGEVGARSARVCVEQGISWGYMNEKHNQHWPFKFGGAADDPAVYAALKELASPPDGSGKAEPVAAASWPQPDAAGGWPALKTSEEIRQVAGLNPAKLDEALALAMANTKNGGLLVARGGVLVYEKYFGLGHHEAAPNLASCGKSFTSVAVGILMAEHLELFPEGLDQKIWRPAYLPPEAFPPSDPAKAEIKLGQLLCFTAGIRGNNPGMVNGKEVRLDPAGPDGATSMYEDVALGGRELTKDGRTFSARTLWCPPGGGYSYASSSAHLASMIVRHVSGMELKEFVRRRLAEPLGWGSWNYGYQASTGITHTPGGGGIALRPTDMLRFGYLMLRGGRWAGRQVVPADYVRACGRPSPYNPHSPYSLQFDVNADGHVAGAPRDAFWKMGSGGHVLYIVPSLDLVIWKMGGRDGQYEERDTGVKIPAPAWAEMQQGAAARASWKASLSDGAAMAKVLEKVVAAVIKSEL